MKNKKLIPIIILVSIIMISAGLWFSGAYKKIFSGGVPEQVGNALTLDLTSLQTTMRTVSSPLIEELQFVQAIDTLSRQDTVENLRNPFVRVYVAPRPEDKLIEKPVSGKKPTKKPVKKKKRIVRPKITINGIIWDRSYPYAILNNDIYGVGDLIQGYTIQTIQDTMIVLANNYDQYVIVIERE
ncbi:hypothetical protein HQ531_01635 [bacterium]|nr:hypothetical protein [bacterium]